MFFRRHSKRDDDEVRSADGHHSHSTLHFHGRSSRRLSHASEKALSQNSVDSVATSPPPSYVVHTDAYAAGNSPSTQTQRQAGSSSFPVVVGSAPVAPLPIKQHHQDPAAPLAGDTVTTPPLMPPPPPPTVEFTYTDDGGLFVPNALSPPLGRPGTAVRLQPRPGSGVSPEVDEGLGLLGLEAVGSGDVVVQRARSEGGKSDAAVGGSDSVASSSKSSDSSSSGLEDLVPEDVKGGREGEKEEEEEEMLFEDASDGNDGKEVGEEAKNSNEDVDDGKKRVIYSSKVKVDDHGVGSDASGPAVSTLLAMFGPPHGDWSVVQLSYILDRCEGNVTVAIENILSWLGDPNGDGQPERLVERLKAEEEAEQWRRGQKEEDKDDYLFQESVVLNEEDKTPAEPPIVGHAKQKECSDSQGSIADGRSTEIKNESQCGRIITETARMFECDAGQQQENVGSNATKIGPSHSTLPLPSIQKTSKGDFNDGPVEHEHDDHFYEEQKEGVGEATVENSEGIPTGNGSGIKSKSELAREESETEEESYDEMEVQKEREGPERSKEETNERVSGELQTKSETKVAASTVLANDQRPTGQGWRAWWFGSEDGPRNVAMNYDQEGVADKQETPLRIDAREVQVENHEDIREVESDNKYEVGKDDGKEVQADQEQEPPPAPPPPPTPPPTPNIAWTPPGAKKAIVEGDIDETSDDKKSYDDILKSNGSQRAGRRSPPPGSPTARDRWARLRGSLTEALHHESLELELVNARLALDQARSDALRSRRLRESYRVDVERLMEENACMARQEVVARQQAEGATRERDALREVIRKLLGENAELAARLDDIRAERDGARRERRRVAVKEGKAMKKDDAKNLMPPQPQRASTTGTGPKPAVEIMSKWSSWKEQKDK